MFKRVALPLLLAIAMTLVAARPVAAQAYKVVVNGGTDVGEVSKGDVAKLFLKQERKFPSGAVATIVDQAKASPVRATFSTAVIGRSVGAIEQYWQQQLFSGREVPPITKTSDDDVLALVKSTPGAIGYVSDGATIPSGVKVLSLK